MTPDKAVKLLGRQPPFRHNIFPILPHWVFSLKFSSSLSRLSMNPDFPYDGRVAQSIYDKRNHSIPPLSQMQNPESSDQSNGRRSRVSRACMFYNSIPATILSCFYRRKTCFCSMHGTRFNCAAHKSFSTNFAGDVCRRKKIR